MLADPARGGLLDGASEYVRRRGGTSERVAASILTQVYANRLVGVGIGCWVTGRIVPALSPDCVLLGFDGARPVRTALRYERVAGVGHNAVATSCATAFVLLHRSAPEEQRDQVRLDALEFFAQAGWPVHGLIEWQPATAVAAAAEPLKFGRRTCCLFRLIPGEMPCDECPLPSARS